MIRPFTLQKICELRKQTDLPIIGLGGVSKWQDGIEMVMAGANYVGVCSAAILKGPEFVGKLDKQMEEYLLGHGYKSLEEISGIVQDYLPVKDEKEEYHMKYDPANCKHCQRCIKVCPYQARSFDQDNNMVVDEKECRKCGLCVSLCKCLSL